MNFREKLEKRIENVGSFLCVGLDPRPERVTGDLEEYLVSVIDQSAPYAAAFKPNLAYYEALGSSGYSILESVLKQIPAEIPIIIDAKRGDIGETQKYYARACFEYLGADAVTVNPYLGLDSLEPWFEYPDKGIFVLGLTSNPGAADVELLPLASSGGIDVASCVYERIVEKINQRREWEGRWGLVMGLTNITPDRLSRLPDVPLLVPGLGAQGGDLSVLAGVERSAPVLVNVSRGIMYPSGTASIAESAREYRDKVTGVFPAGKGPVKSEEPSNDTKTLEILRQFGALKKGHFVLASGNHSENYVQSAAIASRPRELENLIRLPLIREFSGNSVDLVLSAAVGGITIGQQAALILGCRALFAERDEDNELRLRRGFNIFEGERILLVEDVMTTGGTVDELRKLVLASGGDPVGVFTVINRTGSTQWKGYPLFSVIDLQLPVYAPEECPLCREGVPYERPGTKKVDRK